MKTTVEISDALLRDVRKLAAQEGVTLRTLMERGLRRVLSETNGGPPFKLRRASFKGKGRQAEFGEAPWESLRDLIYRIAARDRARYEYSRLCASRRFAVP